MLPKAEEPKEETPKLEELEEEEPKADPPKAEPPKMEAPKAEPLEAVVIPAEVIPTWAKAIQGDVKALLEDLTERKAKDAEATKAQKRSERRKLFDSARGEVERKRTEHRRRAGIRIFHD